MEDGVPPPPRGESTQSQKWVPNQPPPQKLRKKNTKNHPIAHIPLRMILRKPPLPHLPGNLDTNSRESKSSQKEGARLPDLNKNKMHPPMGRWWKSSWCGCPPAEATPLLCGLDCGPGGCRGMRATSAGELGGRLIFGREMRACAAFPKNWSWATGIGHGGACASIHCHLLLNSKPLQNEK